MVTVLGLLGLITGSGAGAVVGAVLVVSGMVWAGLTSQARLVVHAEGVTDQGALRVRRWAWGDIHKVETVGKSATGLALIDRAGRSVLLVDHNLRRSPPNGLKEVAAAATRAAHAPDPGPPRPGRIGLHTMALVVVILIAALATWATVDGLTMEGRVQTNWVSSPLHGPASAPPAPDYVYCPNLIARAAGEREAICEPDTMMIEVAAVAGITAGAAALAATGAMAIGRRRLRLVRFAAAGR